MNLRKFGLALILALGLSSPLVLAQQGGGGGGGGGSGSGIPGPTGTGQCFISTASGAGNWIWGSCSGSSSLSFSSLTTGTNTGATLTIGSGATFNTIAGSVIDFNVTAPTAFKLPVLAGATTSANGNIGFDTTNKNWHVWGNAVDNYMLVSPVSGTFNANDCVQIGAAAPGVITLIDSGAGCGGGNMNNSGTPTAGQGAFFTDATHIQGITTTGSGNAVRATSPTFITPVLGAATATSINGLAITTSTGTLAVANAKTATISNTLTFTGTDGSSVAFGTGGTATYTANNLSVFAATTSAQLAGVITDETGSGLLVFGTAPTLSAPVITGAADASGATTFKLPVAAGFASAANGSIGYDSTNKNWHAFGNAVDNLAFVGPVSATYTNNDCVKFGVVAGVVTLVDVGAACGAGGNISGSGTPTSGQAAEFTNATTIQGVATTGSVAYVKSTSPTLITPVLGVATATSINKMAITAPATSSTLAVADGKTATISNTLTFTGTDASSVAFGTGGTVTYTSNNLSVFAATTSAQLAGVLSDEITTGGSAKSVFAVALQGTDTSLLTSGTISASTGVSLCTDANHGATTSGCTATGNTTSTTLTTGFIPVANGANSIVNSLLDDGATTASTLTYTGSGGIAATGGGGTAGYIGIGQGTAQGLGTTSVGLTAGTGVTSWNMVFPGAAGSGYYKCTNASNIVTCSFEAAIDVSSADITGVGTVANGMTGRASLSNHAVLVGAATAAVTQVSGSTGTILIATNSADPSFSSSPVLGGVGLSLTGTLGFSGLSSGMVTIKPQNAAGTYEFDLPTVAGTSGQPLLSGGGAGTPQTYGTLGIGAGGTASTTAAAALIALFPAATRAGDIIYCATFSSGCTSWALLAGNNSGTNFLSESSSGVPSWSAGSSSVALSSVNAASAGNTIANGDNAQVWNWALTTASKSALTFGETTAATSTGTPYLVNIQTLATSTANPLVVTAVGTANGIQVLKTGALTTKGSGGVDSNLLHCDVTDFTKCFKFVDSGITTATTRSVTVPDANSTLVVADTGAANNFLTAISAAGAISKAQPAIANLSDGANIITDSGSLTTHGVAIGSGTKTITSTAAGTAGQPLLSGGAGADPSFTATLSATNGGTALNSSASTGVAQVSAGTWSVSTTLPSGLSATNLTLVTPALGTPASGVLTNATGYVENALTGAAAAGTITEGGATFSVTRAGIATANLTAPWVFQNTNSSNNNTSITVGITSPGTSTGQTTLNVNGTTGQGNLIEAGTGGTWTAGVLSGQTKTFQVSPAGAVTAAVSVSTGTAPSGTAGTGGVTFYGEGTVPTGAASVDAVYAGSTVHALGVNNNANDMGAIVSVPAVIDLTAQSAAKTATNLYLPPFSGRYEVCAYLKVTTAATTSSILGGTTGVVIVFTDATDSVAQSVTIPMASQAGNTITIGTGNTGNTTTTVSQGCSFLWMKTGVQSTYAIGYTSVGGTAMQYEAHLSVKANQQ